MDKRKALLSGLTLLIVLAAAALILPGLGNGAAAPGLSGKAYFYDLNTGELFVADADHIPPIDAPSGALRGTSGGNAGVRAYVFTCSGDCVADRFIAWIETYTPEAQKALTEGPDLKTHPLTAASGSRSPLVASVNPDSPGDVYWVAGDSPEGMKIVRLGGKPCSDGSAPKPCLPR